MTRPLTGERVTQVVLGLLGLVLVAVGAFFFVDAVPVGQWLRVVEWLAALVVLHDGLVAPAAVVLGFVLLSRIRHPAVARVLRPALLVAAAAAVVAVPLLATGGLR